MKAALYKYLAEQTEKLQTDGLFKDDPKPAIDLARADQKRYLQELKDAPQ